MGDERRLTKVDLARVIERASIIDQELSRLSVGEVQEIARELGISEEPVYMALAEMDPPRGQPVWREAFAFGAFGAALAWGNQSLWGVDGVFGWTPAGHSVSMAVLMATLMVRAILSHPDRPHLRFQAASLAAWLTVMATTMFLRGWEFYTLAEFAWDPVRGLPAFAGPSAAVGALIVAFRRRWPKRLQPSSGAGVSEPGSRGILRRIKAWFSFLGLTTESRHV